MKIILLILALVAAWVGYGYYQRLSAASALVRTTVPFQREGDGISLLVLGDSTAVGVGAGKPEESVPGLFASEINAKFVENYAVSGAIVSDIESQMSRALRPAYDYVLIQIGANDIIRFRSATESAEALSVALKKLPASQKLIVLTAGNVGGAPLFPFFLRQHYRTASQTYDAAFRAVVEKNKGIFITLYDDPTVDPFLLESNRYFAADGLHPTSAGYAIWFEKLRAQGGTMLR